MQALAQPVGIVRRGAVLVRLAAKSGCRRRPTPMVGLSPKARLKPPLGMPMLSMMVSISLGGITWRISRSISAKITSVCSMRVPEGARACRRIWPESTVGKKSRPMNTARHSDPATKRPKPASTGPR